MGWFLLMFPIVGISLAPFGIYIKKEYLTFKGIANHEKVHWKQQLEMLIIFFYLWYGIEWLIRRLFINGKNAYKNISFEREAYANEYNFEYLQARKHFNWFKYMKKSDTS